MNLIDEVEGLSDLMAQIEALKKEADCSDIVQALENAGVDMGNGEQCQDIITAIEILEGRIKLLKEKLLLTTCEKIYWSLHGSGRPEERDTPIQYVEEARQQLKEEMKDLGVEWG